MCRRSAVRGGTLEVARRSRQAKAMVIVRRCLMAAGMGVSRQELTVGVRAGTSSLSARRWWPMRVPPPRRGGWQMRWCVGWIRGAGCLG